MSIKHLTFKEYLNSKDQLMSGLVKEPIGIVEYEISNYCKISLGDSIKTKTVTTLKPDDVVSVEWNYTNKKSPKCLSMTLEGVSHNVYWKNEKILKWIEKNTKDL